MKATSEIEPAANLFCGDVLRPMLLSLAMILSTVAFPAHADQIEMQNGDRYNGKVLSLTNDVVVLQSEVLGTINVPRSRVAKISLGVAAAKAAGESRIPGNTPDKTTRASTNSGVELLTSLQKSGGHSSEAQQVKQQILGDADPAAKAKFDEMLDNLLTGKMTMTDLRVQAKSAADQLKGLKKELGSEADPTLDGYLAVLESFLREAPANAPTKGTNTPYSSPVSKAGAAPEQE